MATKADYKNQMDAFATEKAEKEAKKAQYEKFLENINQMNQQIGPVINQMRQAESSFANGGYVAGNKSLTEGKLLTQADRLSSAQSNLQSVIKAAQLEIVDLSYEIRVAESNYQSAKAAYEAAPN